MWHEIHMNGIAMSNDIWIDLSSQGGVISALHVARTRWLRSCMVGKEVCWIEYSSAPTVDDSPQLMVELEEKTSPSKQLPWNGKHMKHIWKNIWNIWCLSFLLFELFHFGWKLKRLQSSESPRACGWYLGRIHFLFWHLWLLSWRRCKVTEGKMIIGLDRAAPWLDWPWKMVGGKFGTHPSLHWCNHCQCISVQEMPCYLLQCECVGVHICFYFSFQIYVSICSEKFRSTQV